MTSEKGFTLLEVLVALAVLAISLAVLLPVFSDVVKKQDTLALERTAIALGQSKLDAIGSEIPLVDGVTEGAFPNGFGWRLEIAPYSTDSTNSQIFTKLATLTVRWPGLAGRHRLTVQTIRLVGRQ